MGLVNRIAPLHSRRRLALSMVRDAWRRPGSLAARLSAVNRANAKICASLRIHCNVCGIDGGMVYDYPDVKLRREHGIGLLRETLNCRACGASMRQRQMAFGLLELAAFREGTRPADLRAWRARVAPGGPEIVDTDSFSAISYVLRGMPGYLHTQYKPKLRNGDRLADGSINADLLAMPFADDSLDVIMTSDVMEHVRDDAGAHREIHRCLRTGGVYLFTVPYDPTLATTRPLTLPTDTRYDAPPFVLEHHVHGDPHSGSGIVAHRIYGKSLVAELDALGFQTQFLSIQRPEEGVYGGDLFMARKVS